MRTCQSCGKENPSDRDFCDCGEYLRWEPTGVVEAVTPDLVQGAPPAPADAPAAPPPPPPAPEVARDPIQPPPAAPARARPGTLVQGAAAPQADPAPAKTASLTLRLPDDSAASDAPLAVGVDPGGRERVLGLLRNQSGIVDNYDLSVRGMPDSWWTVFPETLYLVPFGAGGTYEQEVEVHLHPPRSAEAEARLWELELVAMSKASGAEAATAPFVLGIQPFEDLATKVEPERASGRRRVRYEVRVENKANAPTLVGFDGADPDGECDFAFSPPAAEVPPGETQKTTMSVRPPKQLWIGRPQERRLEVQTRTGDAVAASPGTDPAAGDGLDEADGAGAMGMVGKAVRGPKVSKPRFGKPNVSVGPGGVRMRGPQVRAPQVRGPQLKQMNLRLDQLKMPSRGQGAPAAAGPLLPTQVVFRQKPWLPWWVAIVLPLLAVLAVLLYLFLPKNVEVPDVVGQKSAFEAEKLLTGAQLKLAPVVKEKVDAKAEPGSVLSQTPAAGEASEEGAEVALLVAVGSGKVTVPDLVGGTPVDAEKALRDKGLSLGQATPQPVDPKAEIKSQIPAANEIAKEGTPVDIFTAAPGAGKGAGAGAAVAGAGAGDGGEGEGAAAGGAGGDGGEGGGEGGPVEVPEFEGVDKDTYAQTVGDAGLVPKVKRQFDPDAEVGAVFAVRPGVGKEVEPGAEVTVLVSAGFPQLAFDDDRDVLLATGSTGKRLEPIAEGPVDEKDPSWSADGSRIAFTSDGRVFVRSMEDAKASPQPLTPEGERYRDLAWAPTADVETLALIKSGDGTSLADAQSSLCFGAIDGDEMTTRCKETSEIFLGRKVNWAENGKSLLVFGARPDGSEFGMVGFRSRRAFSADPADWKGQGFVTGVGKPGEGVLDAAPSPDGKQLAVVLRSASGTTNLLLAKADDLPLANARPLGVRACKVIWRPDGRELVVVRNDDCLASETGELIRLAIADPKVGRSIGLRGDNPTFQPLAAE